MRIGPPQRHLRAWVVWDSSRRRILGHSFFMFWEEEANQAMGSFWVNIRPEARRQRLGVRLLEPLVEVARQHGRTMLDVSTRPAIPAGAAFVETLGAEHRFTGHQNELRTSDVDLDLMHSWVERAKERAAEYHLEAWDGACPDHLVDDYLAAVSVMNTAPREDIEAEDDIVTVEWLRNREKVNVARGADQWVLTAIHEPTGHMAGFTEIIVPSLWPSRAHQQGTAVDPAHRGNGLGRWLKAAMILRLIDERPMVERVGTENAGSNEPMLNINHAMGFRCVEAKPVHQVTLDVLAERIKR
jgi:GNAT superfamily N-acetyltransferase